mgnify:CR=1 FL=1
MADGAALAPSLKGAQTPESKLLDHVERVQNTRAGRIAVFVHLSRLQPHNQQPHHIRIASRIFDSLLNSADVQLFILSTGDLVLVGREVSPEEIDDVIDKVRSLFKSDAVAESRERGQGHFTTWFDLEYDFDMFIELIRKLAEKAEKNLDATREDASAGRERGVHFSGQALSPNGLARVLETMGRVRFAEIIRSQPAVIIGGDGTENILFEENYVSISELQQRIAPGFNLVSNTWLFQHLTETIDKHILHVLAKNGIGERKFATSINLNIATVLGRGFEAFDRFASRSSNNIIIEMQQIDVFANIPAYRYARDWLRERGYRVLIDGLNPVSLRLFDPGMLDPDFVKVAWGTEYSGRTSAQDRAQLSEIIETVDREKFILARTDSEAALAWALQLGIRRFQGFFIDKLVAKQISKEGNLVSTGKRR